MRAKIIGSALLVAVLAAGIFWLRHEAPSPRAEGGGRLYAFDDRDVTGLTLTTRSETSHLARQERSWRLTAPVADAADPAAVATVLASLRQATVVQTIASGDPAASYGLEPPVTRIALEGVTLPALDVGDVAPTGEGVFARAAGRAEILVLRLPDAAALVALDASRLRTRTLLDLPQTAVTGVALAPAGVKLARKASGWWIEAPRRFPASDQAVGKLLAGLTGAEVLETVDAADRGEPRFGLGPAALRFTLASDGGDREVIIGESAGSGRRFAWSSVRGPVLIVAGAPFDGLPLGLDALREAKLTPLNRYHVARFTYTASGRSLALTREGESSWKDAAGRAFESGAIYALLAGVLEARTTAWADGSAPGAPSAALDYVLEDGTKGRVAFFGTRAAWSELPGVTFTLASPPPAVPQS